MTSEPVATPEPVLALRAGDAACTISPASGGSIASWTIGDQQLLRRASAHHIAARAPLGMASFPLVPYSNRIGDARFDWQGERVQLIPNFPPEPHAIHGIGWQRGWRIRDVAQTAVELDLEHGADGDWPWPFLATQRVSLTPTTLTLSLAATNLHTHAVPLGFGHHPYFEAARANLQFAAATIWSNDDRALPCEPQPPAGPTDFAGGAPVEGRALDNCYSGWDGTARIAWSGRPWALRITTDPPLPAAVVYVPQGGDAFCFEPVPHLNDALNRDAPPAAMPVIAPGASFAVDIMFEAHR